jgi:phytoene dehydrogenase-like protein
VSLKQVLDDLTDCDELKALLSGYCMCHGSRPSEISFANHARICRDFYISIGRVRLGGDAFINAFKDAFSRVSVDIVCNTTIAKCLDIDRARIGRLLLTNGDEVTFESCIFTIHPKLIINLLPRENLRKALIHRVEDFESSCGFFSVFGIQEGNSSNNSDSILGMFSSTNMDAMLDYECPDDIAILLLRNEEIVNGKNVRVFTALEPSFTQDIASWNDSNPKNRSAAYHKYKEQKTRRIEQYLKDYFGTNGETYNIKTSSTMLTYRNYLHSPDGSAYGIKQLIGQFNLFGRLPLRNMYVIGQSALLPGIVGSMMSAFIVARSVVDKEKIDKLIARSLFL